MEFRKKDGLLETAEEFAFKDFKRNVAKFVGEGFVLPHGHWFNKKIIKNNLKYD